ncbi:hypothetical protein [Leptothoe spongobia]|uniref:Uncharacterized protein n=1 Tax=Leptothoe spongobia TAU-MAC 1115 TaxID=1967444 RepID=A0A947DC01_9CYAN|nr:hypothetical protein [Leptothoe spongobia]MBT9314385.1 hypothetical protein [Leptothoe spongobia TAU-MAC 1115]
MATTVKQSAVDSLSLVGPILGMMPTAAINEAAVALHALIEQQAQDIASNNTDITALQAAVADLPNLQDAERQEVLALIQDNLPDLSYTVNYRGEQIAASVFSQMLADQQAIKPVEVTEVNKTNGHVTSAKIVFDDASEQTITFTRTVNADGTIATYVGQIGDGSGGLVDGYEYTFGIEKLTVAGLVLSSSWDADLLSQKLFVSNLSIQFDALSSGEPGAGDEAPATL